MSQEKKGIAAEAGSIDSSTLPRCSVTGRVIRQEPPGKWRRFGSTQAISIRWAEAEMRLEERLSQLICDMTQRQGEADK